MLLPTSELRRRLTAEFSRSTRCWVYSAFATQAGVKLILDTRSTLEGDRLLVRCTVSDVVSGACSLEALHSALTAGISVRISTALHVKLYVFDYLLYVGSANLTAKGLALVGYCNDELSAEGVPSLRDIEIAENLWRQGTVIDFETLQLMMDFIDQIDTRDTNTLLVWPEDVLCEVRDLYCSDFPQGAGTDKARWDDLAKVESSAAYKWLLEAVKENGGSASFGHLSSDLHSAVYDDPAPYRREIKDLLTNLLNVIEEHESTELIIKKPNYSSVVFLRTAYKTT